MTRAALLTILFLFASCEIPHFKNSKNLRYIEFLPVQSPLDPEQVSNQNAKSSLFKQLQSEILLPKCKKCHKWVKNEQKVIEFVDFNDPLDSDLWWYVETDEMPPKSPALNMHEKELIKAYILEITGTSSASP
jgi:hypothetical protein